MRPLVRTKRQARQRLQIAFNATEDVLTAARGDTTHHVLPPAAITHVAQGRSHLRRALLELNHSHSPNK